MIYQEIKKNWNLIETIGLSVPFLWLLVGEFLQTASCKGLFVCQGLPDFLTHSFQYDVFFLRAGYLLHNSHWFSELLLGLFYFVCLGLTRDPKFSFIFTVFFGVYHEVFWSSFEYIYNQNNVYGGQSTFYIAVLSVLFIYAILLYRKFFFTVGFAMITSIYLMFLETWWLVDKLHETVIYNGLSPFYYDLQINGFEVGGYFLIFCMFCAYLAMFKKNLSIKKRKQIEVI